MSNDLERAALLSVPPTISEAEADCLGMPVEFYKRAVGFGASLVATYRALPAQPEGWVSVERDAIKLCVELLEYAKDDADEHIRASALSNHLEALLKSSPWRDKYEELRRAPSTQERAGEVAAKDTAAGNGGQVSLPSDSQESPADGRCQPAVPSPVLPKEPTCMSKQPLQMTIGEAGAIKQYAIALRQFAVRLQEHFACTVDVLEQTRRERDRLQAELAEEKKLSAAISRDCNATALSRNEYMDRLGMTMDKLLAAKLTVGKLREYARHKYTCYLLDPYDERADCTCGLSAALREPS